MDNKDSNAAWRAEQVAKSTRSHGAAVNIVPNRVVSNFPVPAIGWTGREYASGEFDAYHTNGVSVTRVVPSLERLLAELAGMI